MHHAFLFFLVVGIGVYPAYGQAEPDNGTQLRQAAARGIVWEMPSNTERAVRDLQEMWRIGVEAVRTSVIRDREVLTFADTLGIDLYIDLPITRLPAKRLQDTLAYATAFLHPQLAPVIQHES